MNVNRKLIVHLVSNREWGGGEQYVLDLCNELRENNERVLIACRSSEVAQNYINAHHDIIMLPLKGFIDLYSPIKLWKKLRREDKIILHVHNFKDAFTAAVLKQAMPKIRILMTRHLVKPAKNDAVYNYIYSKLDKVIFVSNLAQKTFNSVSNKLDASRQVSVLNGTKLIDKIDGNIPPSLTQNKPIIMYHGRLSPEKGIDLLLNAVAKVDTPFKLILIGTGATEYIQNLQNIIDKNRLNEKVEFLGFRHDAAALTAYASFGVLPSIASESCGLSNMEYMSHGKAQITSNNGAQAEYLKDGDNAFLIDAGDEITLAKRIKYLLDNPQICSTMGLNAKEYYDANLRYEKFYDKIQSIYNNL